MPKHYDKKMNVPLPSKLIKNPPRNGKKVIKKKKRKVRAKK